MQTLQENWLGREVRVTKTEPGTPLQFALGSIRVVGWHEVPDPVREKLPVKTRFMALSGQGDQVYTVLVPVDHNTIYDWRENRLVMLTDHEVVQVSPA